MFRQLSPPDFDSELQRRLYAPPPELLSTFWTDVVDLRFTLSGHLHQITLGTHLDPTAAEQGTQLILRPEFSNQRTHSKWR